jgi:HlyD family secretion protein
MYRKMVLILLILLLPAAGVFVWANNRAEIVSYQDEASRQFAVWLSHKPVRTLLMRGADRAGVRSGNVATQLEASGFIEATTVPVMAEVGGRITFISEDEGDPVQSGTALVYLDEALLQAQLKRAQAELRVAEATLSKLEAGATPEEILKAEALVDQAEAAENGAYVAWQDAIVLRDNQQELDLQIDLAQAQAESARYRVNGADANKDAAQLSMDAYGRQAGILHDGVDYSKTLPTGDKVSGHISFKSGDIDQADNQWNQATNSWWQSWINLDTASGEKEQSDRYLNDLIVMREDPQALRAQVDRAESGYNTARAETDVARAQLDWIEAGPTAEQIEAARAQLEQARANVKRVSTQLEKTVLTAPISGRITERMVNPGELAQPHATLLTIANLDGVTLTVYVPEDEIGRVTVGLPVEVSVDSFPERTFDGQVSLVATEAEFTPKNVQTPKQRVNMVFAVKVALPNPDHDLKAGMPADAVLLVSPSEITEPGG